MTTLPPTPESDKLRAVVDKSQTIGEFLDWLQADGVIPSREHEHSEGCYEGGDRICGTSKGELTFDHESIESRLARYFEIDLRKVEAEKRAILDAIRSANA